MGSAVKPIKTGRRVQVGTSQPRRAASPIDKAKAYEVVWQDVAPLFEAARPIVGCCFVYFIGEPDGGPVKIGVSKDPVARLRGMQTGNPRRLRIERVLIGAQWIEKLLHEIWEEYAIKSARATGKSDVAPGTEWFEPIVRPNLLAVIATAAQNQINYIAGIPDDVDLIDVAELERCVRAAHGEHGIEAKRRDVLRYLANNGGGGIARGTRV